MKNYSNISKFGIVVAVIGILVLIANLFFDIFKSDITINSYIISFAALFAALFANIAIAESNKKKTGKV